MTIPRRWPDRQGEDRAKTQVSECMEQDLEVPERWWTVKVKCWRCGYVFNLPVNPDDYCEGDAPEGDQVFDGAELDAMCDDCDRDDYYNITSDWCRR